VVIDIHGTASFGLSFATAFISKNDDAMGCNVLNMILHLPIAPLGDISPPPNLVEFSVPQQFNICRAERTVYVTPVEPGLSAKHR